jgi:hypothetical protein
VTEQSEHKQIEYWKARAEAAEAKLFRVAQSAADMRGAVERHTIVVDSLLPKGTVPKD